MTWLSTDIENALCSYPKLKFDKKNFKVLGSIEIINPNTNEALENYQLEIIFPKGYPNNQLPIVKEVTEKIPRTDSRHVYSDGRFCLTTALQEFLICRKGINFTRFLSEIVYPFLATQLAISCGWLDKFPQGEYSHGYEGIYETYSDFLNLNDLELICKGIEMSFQKNHRNSLCFCGSTKKLKKCHLRHISILKNISTSQLKNDLQAIVQKKKLKLTPAK